MGRRAPGAARRAWPGAPWGRCGVRAGHAAEADEFLEGDELALAARLAEAVEAALGAAGAVGAEGPGGVLGLEAGGEALAEPEGIVAVGELEAAVEGEEVD